ncbi:MAG: hypothetical protein ACR2FF_00205 [Mycobacteriales bacterium]
MLEETARRWREHGRPPQPASRWSRVSWEKEFESYRDFLRSLPDRVGRGEATDHARDASGSAEGAVRAFLAAMIWGYGPVGYGPYRTARVLRENPDAADRLAEIAGIAQREGGLAAFEHVASQPLRYLGVAFGTKYLYFCAEAGKGTAGTAPVLDAVVRRWLVQHAGIKLGIESWRSPAYRRYLEVLADWSTQLGLHRGEVEELIFREGISREGSALWGEAWAGTDAPLEPAEIAAGARRALAELRRLFGATERGLAAQAQPHLDALAGMVETIWPAAIV